MNSGNLRRNKFYMNKSVTLHGTNHQHVLGYVCDLWGHISRGMFLWWFQILRKTKIKEFIFRGYHLLTFGAVQHFLPLFLYVKNFYCWDSYLGLSAFSASFVMILLLEGFIIRESCKGTVRYKKCVDWNTKYSSTLEKKSSKVRSQSLRTLSTPDWADQSTTLYAEKIWK